jgi:hypothetical protein
VRPPGCHRRRRNGGGVAMRDTQRRASLLSPRWKCAHWHHRLAAGMDGLDDFRVVDALQVDRRDAEVGVAELALDDDQRDAFARQLDGMGVPQLVGREAPPDPGVDGGRAEGRSRGSARPGPRIGPLIVESSGPTGSGSRSSSHGCSRSTPTRPCRPRDARLPLPADEQGAAALIEIGLGKRERFWMRSPARHKITISPRSRRPWASSPAARITATICSTLGGSAG